MKYFDNTRVTAYKRCPRKFFYRHYLHWTPDSISINLANGKAWHGAMDVIWETSGKDVNKAVDMWVALMEEEGFEVTASGNIHDINFHAVYTSGIIRTMLNNYVDKYKQFLSTFVVISIEEPFAVPLLSGDVFYIGRLDKVVADTKGHIRIIEHKTTSAYKKEGYFKSTFLDSFSPNSQIDGYLYAGTLIYGPSFRGLYVDAALMHKTVHQGFKMIPIEKKFEMLDLWLFEATSWIEAIRTELESLKSNALIYNNSRYLPAFPRKTEECATYTGCPYQDICRYVPNPLQLDKVPDGFIYSPWEPFSVVGLDKMNFEGEEIENA